MLLKSLTAIIGADQLDRRAMIDRDPHSSEHNVHEHHPDEDGSPVDQTDASAIARLPLLRSLQASERAEIEAALQRMYVPRGTRLIKQGDEADTLYLVGSGRFAIYRDDGDHPIAEIGSGQPIGEIAFFSGGERTADVYALRDSVIYALNAKDFDRLAEKYPSLLRVLLTLVSERLAETIPLVSLTPDTAPARSFAIVAAGSSELDRDVLEHLFGSLNAISPVCLIDEEMLEADLRPINEVDEHDLTIWLNSREEVSHTVLFCTDPSLTDWTRKILGQADQVLFVADASAAPRLNETEAYALTIHKPRQRRLILVHKDKSHTVTGTAAWMMDRDPYMHHHVSRGNRVDFDRLARFLSGTALGFVACGGGAYSAAHIGVYKAFLEAGLDFDIFGGTSGGGAMTAAFAAGRSPEEVDERTHDIFVASGALTKLTLPFYALIDHTHFDRTLRKHYEDYRIEDFWRPFFAVSTDWSQGKPHLHRSGLVWEAVRATGSIPAALPPFVTKDGHLLVDGAVMDNVPVAHMCELKSGPNVVVNFTNRHDQPASYAYHDLPDRRTLLWRMLTPFGRKKLPQAPSIGTVMMRSMMLNGNTHAASDAQNLVITPPIPKGASFMDWRPTPG